METNPIGKTSGAKANYSEIIVSSENQKHLHFLEREVVELELLLSNYNLKNQMPEKEQLKILVGDITLNLEKATNSHHQEREQNVRSHLKLALSSIKNGTNPMSDLAEVATHLKSLIATIKKEQ